MQKYFKPQRPGSRRTRNHKAPDAITQSNQCKERAVEKSEETLLSNRALNSGSSLANSTSDLSVVPCLRHQTFQEEGYHSLTSSLDEESFSQLTSEEEYLSTSIEKFPFALDTKVPGHQECNRCSIGLTTVLVEKRPVAQCCSSHSSKLASNYPDHVSVFFIPR